MAESRQTPRIPTARTAWNAGLQTGTAALRAAHVVTLPNLTARTPGNADPTPVLIQSTRSVTQPSPPRPGAWKRSLRLIAVLLAIWFTASLGLGVLLVEPLNRIWMGGFPLGFWFAQQGAILVFLVLLVVNAIAMDRIEGKADRSDDTEDPS